MFEAPIPGQSLTDEPGNFDWEQPPTITDPDPAIVYHIDRLYTEEVAEGALFMLEFGFPVDTLVDSILTAAVGQGMHSIDMSLTIAPIIHEEITWMAKTAGIDFIEFFSDNDEKKQKEEAKLEALIKKSLEDQLSEEEDKVDESFVEETAEAFGTPQREKLTEMREEQPQQPQEPEVKPDAAPKARGQGLMSRGA
jgi:hypothetical protein